MRKIINSTSRFKRVVITNSDSPVQSGLSLTPAEMWHMAEQGKPITSGMLSDDYFDDGLPSKDLKFDDGVPLERKRGIDVADVWQQSMSAKKKIKKGHEDFTQKCQQYQQQQQQQKGGE